MELDGPLNFDLDTPDDLLRADLRGLDHEAAAMSGRVARPCRRPARRAGLSVVALDGMPEVRAGDDLAALLVAAIRATPGALPLLAEDDVLVVTQKIVSKAEGAIVDLTTITPAARGGGLRRSAGTAIRASSRSSSARRAASSAWPTAS